MDTGGAGGNEKAVLQSFSEIAPWFWVLFLSGWGGVVSYFHRIESGKVAFSCFRLVVDITTSGFVGVLTYLLCESGNVPSALTAFFVGISGHMGTRGLFLLERKYTKFFGPASEEGNGNGKDQT